MHMSAHPHILKKLREINTTSALDCDVHTGIRPQSALALSTWLMQQLRSALKGKISFSKILFQVASKALWRQILPFGRGSPDQSQGTLGPLQVAYLSGLV